ncbi:hypothetical protein ACTAF0_30095 [Streptomyces murinus]|uniref:hypothetical protein n=1 Tax=Streptomyces murinus TaxID=33900 RepID=UPI003F46E848
MRDRRAEAYRAVSARFQVRWTSDRAQRWFDQVTAGVVASILAAFPVWMLTRGH